MIHYYSTEKGKVRHLSQREAGCWINIAPPFDQDQLEELSSQLLFPLDFLTDSLDIDERSRYEREDGVRLIVVNTPVINEDDSENEAIYITAPIGIILADEHMITISPVESPVLNKFLEGVVKGFDSSNEANFVLLIFEQTVFAFLDVLKKLNLKRNLIERELFDSSRTEELRQLLRIEKSLVYMVNTLSSNELLLMKMKRTDFLRINGIEEEMDLFEDIIIDNSQALEMANVHTNILGGTMEAYASIISNYLNTVIHRLTIVTIILMVPTLVASFYGMNVPLPFGQGKSDSAFLIILIISVLISLFLVWFFRRKQIF